MASPAGTATCATHPKRDRVASCGSCGNGLCKDCIVPTAVGFKCRTCTGTAGRHAEAPPAASPRKTRPGRPRWLWPAVGAGVVVVLIAGFVVAGSGGGDDGAVRYADEDTGDPAERSTPVERQVELPGGSATRISATLTLPPRAATPTAAVLFVPGFGAIDRDAVMATNTPDASADRLSQDLNYSRPGTPDNLPRDLNDALLANGAATLRYDKRGSAKSPLPADKALSYDDLVADANAGADFLAQRVETANVALAVVGIDQGGLIAMRMAANPRVKAVMLISTFGRPLAEVIGDDLARRGDAGRVQAAEQLRDVAGRLAAGQPVPPTPEISTHLRPLLLPAQERYLRAIFGLDPTAEAKGVKSRVLLVRGADDTTVTAVDTERLKASLPPGTEEVVVSGGDHNLGTGTRRDPAVMSQLASTLVGYVRN